MHPPATVAGRAAAAVFPTPPPCPLPTPTRHQCAGTRQWQWLFAPGRMQTYAALASAGPPLTATLLRYTNTCSKPYTHLKLNKQIL